MQRLIDERLRAVSFPLVGISVAVLKSSSVVIPDEADRSARITTRAEFLSAEGLQLEEV